MSGTRYTLPSGKQVYLALRKHSDFFRDGRKDATTAWRDGVLGWPFDYHTILTERALGTRYLGIQVKDTGEIWLTHIDAYLNRKLVVFRNYTGRGGTMQAYLNVRHFVKKPGQLKKL